MSLLLLLLREMKKIHIKKYKKNTSLNHPDILLKNQQKCCVGQWWCEDDDELIKY